MSTCSKSHDDVPGAFTRLPESQAKRWRHICAACAYDLGRADAVRVEANLRERVRVLTADLETARRELARANASLMREAVGE